MTELPDTVTLGVQSSGDDDRTAKHVLEFRRLLATSCKGPYSEEITEFALVVRIGGKMQEFDFEGCCRKARADFKAFDKLMRRRGGKRPRPGDELPPRAVRARGPNRKFRLTLSR